MGEEFLKEIFKNFNLGQKAKVLKLLRDLNLKINGHRTLSTVPNQILINYILQNKNLLIDFYKCVCRAYFNTDENEVLTLILEKPFKKENISGYFAIYALKNTNINFNEVNTLINNKFINNENDLKAINVLGDKDQTVNNKDNKKSGEKKMGKYLGYIEIASNLNAQWDFYNFFPIKYLDGNILKDIPDVKNEFPILGNVNIYTFNPNSNILSNSFKNHNHYIIELNKKDYEENFGRTGELNKTNIKINIDNIINKKYYLYQFNIFYVVTADGLTLNNIDFTKPIQIKEKIYSQNEKVLLRVYNKLIGPFTPKYDRMSDSYSIIAGPEKCNFFYDTYTLPENKELNDYILSLKIGDELTSNIIKIDNNFIKATEDFILDEILFERFNDYFVNLKSNLKENKNIFENIRENIKHSNASIIVKNNQKATEDRINRICNILNDDESFNKQTDKIVTLLSNLLSRSAKNKKSDFDAIIELIKDDTELMKNVLPEYPLIKDDIANKKQQISILQSEIDELNFRAEEIKAKEMDKVLQEQKDLKEEINNLKKEKEEIFREISDKKKKKEYIEEIEELEKTLKELKAENENLNKTKYNTLKNIEDKISEIFNSDLISESIAKSIANDVVSKAIIEASAKAIQEKDKKIYDNKIEASKLLTDKENKLIGNALVNELYNKIKKYRDYDYNDIINILICITQGFITVFSGEPGTGKTSICHIIGNVLGLNCLKDVNRFVVVSVERGWTSKRDLIGYYNPLTQRFDVTGNKIYSSLKILNEEINQGTEKYPMIILLDEANLSPMEYYWADFMDLCDETKFNNSISMGNEENIYIPNNLRFLATINNDHTTEILSPRLIDRAWVITLPVCEDGKAMDLVLDNNVSIVPWDALKKQFSPLGEISLTERIERILSEIYTIFRSANISISTRTDKAIRKYCAIAQELFESDERYKDIIAVDYAISQRLLTKINGNGGKIISEGRYYKDFLDDLYVYLKDKSLNISIKILEDIMKKGKNMMDYYQFF